MEIDHILKKRMLNIGIWQVAWASGDFYSRYRSAAVISTPGLTIQRDHIYQKKLLVQRLLSTDVDFDSVIAHSQCCIVTLDEHRSLHQVNGGLDGWDRYQAAKIQVYDMVDKKPVA